MVLITRRRNQLRTNVVATPFATICNYTTWSVTTGTSMTNVRMAWTSGQHARKTAKSTLDK
eukprot:2789950-Lingulodinium_polyedra.AAC.1